MMKCKEYISLFQYLGNVIQNGRDSLSSYMSYRLTLLFATFFDYLWTCFPISTIKSSILPFVSFMDPFVWSLAVAEATLAITLKREKRLLMRRLALRKWRLSNPGLSFIPTDFLSTFKREDKRYCTCPLTLLNNNEWPGSLLQVLPKDSVVLMIYLDETKTSLVSLFIKRHGVNEPFFFKIKMPLLSLSFVSVQKEFEMIMKSNLESTSSSSEKLMSEPASHAKKKEWWKWRRSLNDQLESLLCRIELGWFWIAKYILTNRFESTLTMLVSKPGSLITISQILSKKLMTLQASEATLLVCLVRDTNLDGNAFYHCYKSWSACLCPVDEVEWNESTVMTLRMELKKWMDTCFGLQEDENPFLASHVSQHTHVYLVIDQQLHSLPWESLPFFRAQSRTISLSRIPSLVFLEDALRRPCQPLLTEPPRVSYLLNPSGDLEATQQLFEPFLASLSLKGICSGTMGRCHKLEDSLTTTILESNVYLYFGHGTGAQYVRPCQSLDTSGSKTVTDFPLSFLMGCSSGALFRVGEFEPHGMLYEYLLHGAPAVVANLWDVTDKDIDRFSLSVLQKWGLFPKEESNDDGSVTDLADAVAQSRNACTLPFLVGAAPVVYGLPISLFATTKGVF
jgi:separase